MKKYFILTLGCQMNVSDSQRIATKLESVGYKSASEKEADLVIVNACSVRQKAVDRIWGGIKNWSRDGKKILITGCVLPSDKKKFFDRNVKFFDIKNLKNIINFIDKYSFILENKRISSKSSLDYFHIEPKQNSKVAYIPIMTGCDNFCSYCAVPYTRGREVSRPMDDIMAEVKDAIKNNTKEIWLLGQNVNSYGIKSKHGHSEPPAGSEESPANAGSHIRERTFINIQDDTINNKDFIKLLKEIDNLPGNFKFNFMSSNPHDMSDEIIKTFSELKKWPRELHLAMQSGDDEILKKMNRKCTSTQFLTLIKKLKEKIPTIIIGTDIIVGFPGETKTQFNNTVKICKKIGFEKAYAAQYSPRPGTVSAKMEDNVSAEEKKRRWLVLDKLINNP
ncbi:MAG: MiaB family RNA modification protein [Berkelbacteria bacterium GW2011_GWB1_38_5]|uniref:MiaB family RNA modification protein n=1 Tax=Berkelbacteria bacterium GW2011_GWB1_38_5 TaxID=1618336 RepID=A0A0G0NAG6_9BACT|nr:MAG: MiaB family RNA modification protein [Berkelbacteria bacterium GW2011_GWB1_38_5]